MALFLHSVGQKYALLYVLLKYMLFLIFNLQVPQASLQKDLFTLEKQERAMNLKFGVIYAQNGQFTDDEFFSNTQGSPEFEDFLNLLGDHIILKGKIRQKVYTLVIYHDISGAQKSKYP